MTSAKTIDVRKALQLAGADEDEIKDAVEGHTYQDDLADPSYKAEMILDQGTDPIAAAQRYAVTQEIKDSWRVMINGTNNRGIPEPLKELYDGAYEIMLEIIDYEKDLVMRG